MKPRKIARQLTAYLNQRDIESQLVQSPWSEAVYVYALGDPEGPPRECWVPNPKRGKVVGASRRMKVTKPGRRKVLAKVRVANHAGTSMRCEADFDYVAQNIVQSDFAWIAREISELSELSGGDN